MSDVQNKFIVCDADKCVGCQICEIACSVAKEKVLNPRLSRIHVARLESTSEPVSSIAITCYHCEDPACVKACPRKALSVDEKSGIIRVNEGYSGCNVCGWCIVACEFGAPIMNVEKMVVAICDLCPEHPEPPCVKFCPKDALSLATVEEVIEKSESDVVKKLLQELSSSRKGSKTFYERFGFIPMQPK